MKRVTFLLTLLLFLLTGALLVGVFTYSGKALKEATAQPTSASSVTEEGVDRVVDPVATAGEEDHNDSTTRISKERVIAATEVIASRETPGTEIDEYKRVRIETRDFKYPLIRVEETVHRDPSSGAESILSKTEMVADHLMIKIKPGVDQTRLDALAQQHGAHIRRTLRAPGLYLVAFDGANLDALPEQLDTFSEAAQAIAYAEPDYLVHAIETVPDDARFDELWGMHNTGQTGGKADADIDAVEAWDISTGHRRILVGVIDTGIDRAHPDLIPNLWVNPGEAGPLATNGVDDDGNGFVDDWRGWDFAENDSNPHDGHFHGTHVAGTIGAAGNNAIGVAGVCWKVSLLGIKFLNDSGSGSTADAVEAIYYATGLGVDLTSNSWGGGGRSTAVQEAIEDAHANGILFVAAAGNNGRNADESPMYPAAYENDNIISVAATDHRDALASFSNYGEVSVDLAAPGVAVLSTGLNKGYRQANGTSMATPHVSGACALLRASSSQLISHMDIKETIMMHVDPLEGKAALTRSGGRLNVYNALRSVAEPVLIVTETRLADPAGNGDGFMNPGEEVEIWLTLGNVAADIVSNLTATLRLEDAQVQLLADTQPFMLGSNAFTYTSAAPFVVEVAANTATPYPVTFDLILSGDDDYAATNQLSVIAYTSSTVSGIVTRAGTSAPLSGAQVTYEGTASGVATTDIEGAYAFTAVDGAYTLVASYPGLIENDPRQTTVPPSAHIDIQIGLPEMVFPNPHLAVAMHKSSTATGAFEIANRGDVALRLALRSDDYVGDDSDMPGGPTYAWEEISDTGTLLKNPFFPSLGDVFYSETIHLDAPVSVYGELQNFLNVNANGILRFPNTVWIPFGSENLNQPLPSEAAPANSVAFFWDNLNFASAGKAYYKSQDDGFTIQFTDVPYNIDPKKRVSAQVRMHDNGDMVCHYKRVDIPNSCTVGVQDRLQERGTTVVYNQPRIRNGMAIRMRPLGAPWLTVQDDEAIIDAGASASLAFSFTNAGPLQRILRLPGVSAIRHLPLRVGTYTTYVEVASTDLDTASLLPIVFTIVGNEANRPPTVQNIATVVPEDRATNLISIVERTATDADNDPLYFFVERPPTNGFVVLTDEGITYTPNTNYFGVDSFTYIADDLESH